MISCGSVLQSLGCLIKEKLEIIKCSDAMSPLRQDLLKLLHTLFKTIAVKNGIDYLYIFVEICNCSLIVFQLNYFAF